ncbi:toprim domain-containing protein [candidate division KSB1 bacterium]|nr:toprim domain-containing protein [candidate division KSB1 bacterium]
MSRVRRNRFFVNIKKNIKKTQNSALTDYYTIKYNVMNIQLTKTIKIHEYLAGLGIQPVSIRGENYWYRAPFREDHHPSLSVNVVKNLWFDLGLGAGGDLVSLVQKIHNCDVSCALHHMDKVSLLPAPVVSSFDRKASSIEIRKVKPLQNPALIKYLNVRGIDHKLASKYLEDVYYSVNDRYYFAVGFRNNSKGYELRNQYWKGSLAPKDITSYENGSADCCVFEGWPDFLSYKQCIELRPSDYIILNSVVMAPRAIEPLKAYKNIFYWGQNDQPGQEVLETLQSAGITLVDCRFEYSKFKDLNEKYSKH